MFRKILFVFLIVIGVVSLFVFIFGRARYYKENSIPLSRQFVDASGKFRFNYPEGSYIYESTFNNAVWVRVFVQGNGKTSGPSCDLNIYSDGRQEESVDGYVVKNGQSDWIKTRDDRGLFGGIYDAHGVRWRLNSKPVNYVWDTRSLEIEQLCERIISTFRSK